MNVTSWGVRPFALTLGELTGLAAGHGSAEAIAKLIAGQLGKRRLLVWGVVRDARARGLPVEEPVGLLLRVHERAPEALDHVLTHPQIDAWAAAFPRSQESLGYLHALAASAAIRARLPFDLVIPPAADAVTLPGLGLLSAADQAVRLTFDDGDLTVNGAPASLPTRREIDLTALDGPVTVIEDADQYRDLYGVPAAAQFGEVDRFAALWRDAWRLLTRHHPEHARAIRMMLRSFVPLEPSRDGAEHSASSSRAFGTIALAPPLTAESLALLVLHEAQHLKLSALLDLVDLDTGPGKARYRAPWRGDPRPIRALLHGTYAHLGVTEFWRGRDPRRFAYWRTQTAHSAAILADSAELTDAGARFVGVVRETLAGWAHEPITAADQRIVEVCGLVNEAVWRLAHRTTSATGLARLLAAWRSGLPPPPGIGGDECHGAPAEARIIRAVRQDRPALPEGDRALLNGDAVQAAEFYARRIASGIAAADDWAGLVVALGGSLRPEVCRDVYAALAAGDAKPDPRDIVRWWCSTVS